MTPSPRPTVFYLTAGRPLGDELSDFEDNLPNLPKDADFMVHLGDWNSPFSTECDEDSYRVVDELFRTSSVPVYFIPGDNEVSTSRVFVSISQESSPSHSITSCVLVQ